MAKSAEDLIAETEIRAIHQRYCRAADRLDATLFRSCFHDDAQLEFPVYQGGLEGFVAMAWETLGRFQATRHLVGNQLVELAGNRAWAEHYTLATHRIAADASGPLRDYVAHMRYIDILERREEWRIVKRTALTDLARTDPVPDLSPPREPDGRRDNGDPSYALAAALTQLSQKRNPA